MQLSSHDSAQLIFNCSNMSACHAGTKKWNKIIQSHLNKHDQQQSQNKATTLTDINLIEVFSCSVSTDILLFTFCLCLI